ncbi:SGNH/GDSL hydrolase family protein [Vibrio sp. 1159]|uniref:SGNH/GDSL hydrolase family protein n=1 Tax=Vibrio sp. 1159 TaxID=3074545 RepID=UPI0029654256|nr:SGNH/GDSL hydrolase family protein [Vibrio sp. 1159]MDW2321327.1 SGNH/GDSL hydrolase family protein [Vibrio sp. 1159]
MSNFPDLLTSFAEAVEALKVKLSQDASKSTTYNGELIQSIEKDLNDRYVELKTMMNGRLSFATKAEMDADTTQEMNALAEVWNDTDVNKNGLYGWNGSVWGKSTYDPRQEMLANFDSVTLASAIANRTFEKWIQDGYDTEMSAPIWGFDNEVYANSWLPGTPLSGFGFVSKYDEPNVISGIEFIHAQNGGTYQYAVSVYKRPDSAGRDAAPPDAVSGDVLLHAETVIKPQEASQSFDWYLLEFNKQIPVVPGFHYIILVEAQNSSGEPVSFACRSYSTEVDVPASMSVEHGFFNSISDPNFRPFTSAFSNEVMYARTLVRIAKGMNQKMGKIETVSEKQSDALGLSYTVANNDRRNALSRTDSSTTWKAGDFTGWASHHRFEGVNSSTLVEAVEFFTNGRNGGLHDFESRTDTLTVSVFEMTDDNWTEGNFETYPLIVQNDVFIGSKGENLELLTLPISFEAKPDTDYIISIIGWFNDQRSGVGAALGIHEDFDNPNLGRYRGFYQAGVSGGWFEHNLGSGVWLKTNERTFKLNNGEFDKIMAFMEPKQYPLYSREWVSNNWSWNANAANPFTGWAVGYDPQNDHLATNIEVVLENAVSALPLNLKVYKRIVGAITSPPGALGDELVLTKQFSATDIEINSDNFQWVTIPVDELKHFEAGFSYLFHFYTDGSGLGTGMTALDLDESDYIHRGWYSTQVYPALRSISGNGGVAIRVLADGYAPLDLTPKSILFTTHNQVDVETSKVSDLTLTVEASLRSIGVNVDIEKALTFDTTLNQAGITEQVNLVYSTGSRLFTNPNPRLQNKYIANVSAVRTDDGTPLEEGVDFRVYDQGGKLVGLVDTATYSIDVTYDGYFERYDLVEYDIISGELTVVKGTNRDRDADEYKPQPTAGKLPLYYVYVAGDKLELIPVHLWQLGIQRGTEDEVAQLQRHNASSLTQVLGKLRRGDDIRLAGYGDSITAVQNNEPPVTTPGGIERDRLWYFRDYEPDTISKIETFDFGDGAGSDHVKEGWNWRLKEHFETAYGVICNYDNWGIGGTTSGTGAKQGLDPTRLNALLASQPDLTVIAFGMNEIGDDATLSNVIQIANQLKAIGSDVIIMGCPRINALGGRASVEAWRKTNNLLYAAAIQTGSAYCSTAYLTDDERLSGIGLSANSMCNSNQYNHPGAYELRRYGHFLASLFLL